MALSVFLFILKIIGIILLCILMLILVGLLLVLFTKFKYNVICGNDKDTYFNCNVSYLFGAVKAGGDYRNDEFYYSVRIFGKKIFGNEPDLKESSNKKSSVKTETAEKEVNKEEFKNTENEFVKKKENDNIKKDSGFEEKREEKRQKNIKEEIIFSEKKPSWQEKYSNIKYDHSGEDFTVRRIKISEITKNAEETENKADFDEKISDSTNNHDFDKLNENIDEHERDGTAYENKIGVKYFLNLPMDDKKVIIAGLYKLLKRFCKTVLPKSVLINAKAGTGNPAGTGLILALCGIIKGLFIEGLNISGDFDDITFLGNAEFSGRFTLGYLLYSAVCFIILKPVRKAIILFIKN